MTGLQALTGETELEGDQVVDTARIRVGIIGLGRSGWDIHADGLARLGLYEIVSAADPVAERRAEAAARFSCSTHSEPAGVIDDPEVELVVVATPSHTHRDLTVAALEARKHVVVEKPMAATVDDVDAMVAAAQAASRVVTCFHNSRFDPIFGAVRDVVSSGRLGDILLIRRMHHRFRRRRDWQTLRKYDGGELSNSASHFLDQVLQLIGDQPVEVFGALRQVLSVGDAEDHVKVCLRTAGGLVADIESSAAFAIPQPAWLIAGSAGGLVAEGATVTVRWCDPGRLAPLEVDEAAAADRLYWLDETIDWHEETIPVAPRHQASTLDFYRALAGTLREGRPLVVTPASVRRQIDIIQRVRESAVAAHRGDWALRS